MTSNSNPNKEQQRITRIELQASLLIQKLKKRQINRGGIVAQINAAPDADRELLREKLNHYKNLKVGA